MQAMKIYVVKDLGENVASDLFAELLNEQHLAKEIREADIYLFCTLGLSPQQIAKIAEHPLVKTDLRKCAMISDEDHPTPLLPGLYTALPRMAFISIRSWKKHFRTICYFSRHNPYIRKLRDTDISIKYLYSFVGSATSGVRQRLLKLQPKRSDVLIRQTEAESFWKSFVWIHGVRVKAENKDYVKNYANEILESKFILCPKGNGNSSYRFFEVIEAGRVPVVISDSYVFPNIPYDWNDIVIRVKERDIDAVEDIIAKNEHRFADMAKLSRKVYDEFFLDKSAFILRSLQEITQTRRLKSPQLYPFFRIKWVTPLKFSYRFKPFVGRMISKLRRSR
ncbi:MAG: hypothetical protein EOO13_12380 [Chitinophagaceae bacterium]|nr:MAG: hypothetical protein EOO13_12380 [Chitinophagaceae bacterium]